MEKNLDWDRYFMGVALMVSLRSKDPNSKNGAVIVDEKNIIIGTGYNGFVRGIDESKFTRNREGNYVDTKYAYVLHAEENAILNATTVNLQGAKLYCNMFPCNNCAKKIAQKGIKKVYYFVDKYPDDEIYIASKKIFDTIGVEYEKIDNIDYDKLKQVFDI